MESTRPDEWIKYMNSRLRSRPPRGKLSAESEKSRKTPLGHKSISVYHVGTVKSTVLCVESGEIRIFLLPGAGGRGGACRISVIMTAETPETLAISSRFPLDFKYPL